MTADRREAENPQNRLHEAVRYAITWGTKRDVRELVEAALAEYDDYGNRHAR